MKKSYSCAPFFVCVMIRSKQSVILCSPHFDTKSCQLNICHIHIYILWTPTSHSINKMYITIDAA